MKQHPRRRRPVAQAASLVCLCLLARGVHAETGPYKLGAGVAYHRDDNLFRAPASEEVADRYATVSVFGGVDETIGRQRVRADLDLNRSSYDERQDLDHTGYRVGLRWNGETVGPFSWDLAYRGRRSLGAYATVVDAQQRVANLETHQQASAGLQLGLQAQWVAGLTLSHRRIDYSAAEFADEQLRVDSAGAHVLWNPRGPVSVSVGPRISRGRYPQARDLGGGAFQADEFERRDLDVGVKWVPDGASTVNARVSLTRQTFDVLGDRDFEGATGLLSWTWQATGKTRLNAMLSRDTGSETSFITTDILGTPQQGSGDNSQVTDSVAARIDYEATAKISLALSGRHAERHLSASARLGDGSTFVGLAGTERSDRVALALRYAPTRNSLLSCDLGHERRTASTALSSSYRANTAGCAAQLAFEL